MQPGILSDNILQVCRICFTTRNKLYPMSANKILYDAYETLTGLSLGDEHNLPQILCANCAQKLMKCARFRTRSLQAYLSLQDIVKKYDRITSQSIRYIDGLHSPVSSNSESEQYDLDDEFLKGEKRNVIDQPNCFHKDVAVRGIKAENDTIDQNQVYRKESMLSNLKTEDHDMTNEDETIDKVNVNVVDDLKEEKGDVKNLVDIIIDGKEVDDDMTRMWNLQKEVVIDCVKTENGRESNLVNYNEDTIGHTIKIENPFLGEDHSAGDNLLTVEIQPTASQSKRGVAKNKKGRKSKVKGGPKSNMLSCDLCPFQTNSESRMLCHLKAHAACKSYNCNKCNYKTKIKSIFQSHNIACQYIMMVQPSDKRYSVK